MDPVLVDRARHGDKEAFTSIVLAMGGRLYSVAYGILRDSNRAEDAVQQALLNAWRQIPRLRDDSRLEAWLLRMVVNTSYTELRHTRRWQPGLHLVTDSETSPRTADAQASVAERDELERAFRHLSGEHRAVLVMHHYLGLSVSEIGETIGLSPGTVRSRLHYARQHMRAALEAGARAALSGGMT
jgi:RNA polymerase sigma-70 factor (ECF subfamily)